MNEFYVGYLPKAPSGIAKRIRTIVVLVFVVAVVVAVGFAAVQRSFAPSVFEFGKLRSFEGMIELDPFPSLLVDRADSLAPSRYLLVAAGKHGAEDQVLAFAGKVVRLRGSLIYRGDQRMIEVVKGSISSPGEGRPPQAAMKDLGAFELSGEIVDSKCYLGVMNPGSGKVHRDCAVRCLSGGTPPMFATGDFQGRAALFVLTDSNQKPLPRNVILDRAGLPVRIRGRVLQSADTLFLETEPPMISELR